MRASCVLLDSVVRPCSSRLSRHSLSTTMAAWCSHRSASSMPARPSLRWMLGHAPRTDRGQHRGAATHVVSGVVLGGVNKVMHETRVQRHQHVPAADQLPSCRAARAMTSAVALGEGSEGAYQYHCCGCNTRLSVGGGQQLAQLGYVQDSVPQDAHATGAGTLRQQR